VSIAHYRGGETKMFEKKRDQHNIFFFVLNLLCVYAVALYIWRFPQYIYVRYRVSRCVYYGWCSLWIAICLRDIIYRSVTIYSYIYYYIITIIYRRFKLCRRVLEIGNNIYIGAGIGRQHNIAFRLCFFNSAPLQRFGVGGGGCGISDIENVYYYNIVRVPMSARRIVYISVFFIVLYMYGIDGVQVPWRKNTRTFVRYITLLLYDLFRANSFPFFADGLFGRFSFARTCCYRVYLHLELNYLPRTTICETLKIVVSKKKKKTKLNRLLTFSRFSFIYL